VAFGCADPGDHSAVVVLRPLTASVSKNGLRRDAAGPVFCLARAAETRAFLLIFRYERERFPAKWIPVRVKKTRQFKNPEPRSDLIGTGLWRQEDRR